VRIGLIAMSGVRAHNAELTRLGLTLPGFVERNRIIASLPSLGLLTLAGLAPREVELEYREVAELATCREQFDYDAVAISSFSAQILEAYCLADRLRAAGTRVILGGLHVTALPSEAARHADAVVIGEGEPVWPDLVADLLRGELKTVYDARPFPFDLGSAPMPRFELLDPSRYNRLTVQTQRGCPFNCEFCAASIRLNPRYRVKPVAKVIAEIRRIKEIWPRPFIEFADDNTFANRRHGRRLLQALAPEKVRWFTETDVSVARDPVLLAMMRDAGCAQVLIGLESATPEGLRGIEKRSDWKSRQRDFYLEAIRRIQDQGISVNGCFVLGLDGTGPESFDRVREFVRESGLHEVQITIQTPFPGTPLYERLKRQGRLTHDGEWDRCTLFDVNFRPERMTVAELESGFVALARDLYGEAETARRKEHFYRQLRGSVHNRHARWREGDERQMG
jgi:radical SAM superfamily enzyme YgiQ (UPF0313 family)